MRILARQPDESGAHSSLGTTGLKNVFPLGIILPDLLIALCLLRVM